MQVHKVQVPVLILASFNVLAIDDLAGSVIMPRDTITVWFCNRNKYFSQPTAPQSSQYRTVSSSDMSYMEPTSLGSEWLLTTGWNGKRVRTCCSTADAFLSKQVDSSASGLLDVFSTLSARFDSVAFPFVFSVIVAEPVDFFLGNAGNTIGN
jgi:hypothetical protein